MQHIDAASIPAAEIAVVGLCHDLNDQLAAVSAYVYLLKRRGVLGDIAEPLQAQLDRLAHTIGLVRSLSRSHKSDPGPVALSLLAESASSLMQSYPEGRVDFEVAEAQDPAVLRCDWTRALRALLAAGAWASRGEQDPVTVRVSVERSKEATALRLEALGTLPPPTDEGPLPDHLADLGPAEAEGRSIKIRLS